MRARRKYDEWEEQYQDANSNSHGSKRRWHLMMRTLRRMTRSRKTWIAVTALVVVGMLCLRSFSSACHLNIMPSDVFNMFRPYVRQSGMCLSYFSEFVFY